MRLKRFNSEVYYSRDPIVAIKRSDIEFLKRKASRNTRRRVRLCAHKKLSDKVHEMLIVLAKGVYIRPHRHRNKVESYHVIQGRVDLVIFNRNGAVKNVTHLGDPSSGFTFFYRLQDASYHTLVVKSPVTVFHETTNGPFSPSRSTMFAPWSPAESAPEDVSRFQRKLNVAVVNFK